MAAGLGTRLRPFSDRIAKPLMPVLGVPSAQFSVDALVSAGVKTIVANVHHLPESTRDGLLGLDLAGAEMGISDESAELLGSAGGIRKALDRFGDEPFFICNADVLCSMDWAALGRMHTRLRDQWGIRMTLALMPIPKNAAESYRAILLNESGEKIAGLGPKSSTGYMYVGCAVVEPELFRPLSPNEPHEFVPEVLEPAIQKGKVGAYLMPEHQSWSWMDIGSPELWWRAHMELLGRLEVGDLPQTWLDRIHQAAVRRAPLVWTGREIQGRLDSTQLAAPLFWGTLQGDLSAGHALERGKQLGPGAVIYGEPLADCDRPGVSALGFCFQTSG